MLSGPDSGDGEAADERVLRVHHVLGGLPGAARQSAGAGQPVGPGHGELRLAGHRRLSGRQTAETGHPDATRRSVRGLWMAIYSTYIIFDVGSSQT